MIGVVRFFKQSERFGIIESHAGKFFCPQSAILPDELGGRSLVLDEDVEFESGEKQVGGNHPVAKNVVPLRLKGATRNPPEDYRAEFRIVKLFSPNRSGLAERMGTNDWFAWKQRDVISVLPSGFRLGIGVRLWAGIRRCDRDPEKFLLREIEVFQEEKDQREENNGNGKTVCEAPAMARETAAPAEVLPVLPSLTP